MGGLGCLHFHQGPARNGPFHLLLPALNSKRFPFRLQRGPHVSLAPELRSSLRRVGDHQGAHDARKRRNARHVSRFYTSLLDTMLRILPLRSTTTAQSLSSSSDYSRPIG